MAEEHLLYPSSLFPLPSSSTHTPALAKTTELGDWLNLTAVERSCHPTTVRRSFPPKADQLSADDNGDGDDDDGLRSSGAVGDAVGGKQEGEGE
jgi:hypothetical protein